jgi:hypothetical protein
MIVARQIVCELSSADAAWLEVTTARCYGHFFIGKIVPCDGCQATLLVTNPRVESDHTYPSFHPLRVIARTLLRAGSLGASHEVLLCSWIESSFRPHHGLSAVDRPETLARIIGKFHGTFLLQTTERKLVSAFLYSGQGVVTLRWIASWSINCLRQSQCYQLDCPFQALYPSVYCILMAVWANVGIPLGIAVAPTECREVFDLFASGLADRGFSRDE